MDLVDIDQVLDNLEAELKADEQLSRNATSAAAAATAALNVNVGGESRPLGDGSAGAAKNFVGVSQVFNSLNDYRNNVQSLATGMQAHESYNWETEAAEQQEEQQPEHVELEDEVVEQEVEEDYEEEELARHEDINKFSESKSKDGNVSSSESLTTSSCSTFSSGPSPGNVSNSEEQEELSTPPESDMPSALELPPKANSELDQQPEQHVAPSTAVEDLATGLSSISITNTNTTESQSILPCEVTASSALGKVLNELSEETSSELETQSQARGGGNNLHNMPAVTQLNPAQVQQPKLQAEPDLQQQQQEQALKRSQPLTFCSTMDEISDTELDSMLQEVEADIEEETEAAAASTSSSDSCLRQPHGMMDDDGDESASISPATEEESVRILSEQETNSADQMNVDNFSQASTVEFAELRATEPAPVVATAAEEVEVEVEAEAEAEASSFSSTASETDSLSGRKLEEDEEEDSVATDALDTQEQRPQRPQTLDLNGGQQASAGQTPPPADQAPSQSQSEDAGGAAAVVAEGEEDDDSPIYEAVGYSDPHANLGKVPPIWVPDNMAGQCMQCQQKFTMIKRRHHCRACGKVLCSVCCSQRFHLQFANEPESRVCVQCFMILTERQANGGVPDAYAGAPPSALPPTPMRSPNPNNPMEYCSTIPPHRQVAAEGAPPPSVIVPVGVLKKMDGSSSNSSSSDGKKGRKRKSVMFSDGIAPGSELASTMEQQWGEAKHARRGLQRSNSGAGAAASANQKPPTPGAASGSSGAGSGTGSSIDNSSTMGLVAQLFRGSIPPSAAAATLTAAAGGSQNSSAGRNTAQTSPRRKVEPQRSRKLPPSDAQGCFIPYEENALPPICISSNGSSSSICDVEYKEVRNDADLLERLQRETLKFIVKNNFYVLVKVVNMSCCMNRWVLNFTTSGLHHVGNDELIILLEIKPPPAAANSGPTVPRDIFQHLYEIYVEAEQARSSTQELAFSSPRSANFLGSREHGGFIYIRPTYQCLQGVIVPDSPYLVAVLIHRHEVPWAKVLPLRLILRLGAQYRYYPCPLISVRNRESVYGEIAQTIINFLVDFRNYTYSLPAIRGLYIHMEDRQTTVIIPRYRQNDVIKAINNSTDHILAFAGNFSKVADGHLVCMQNINDDRSEMYAYSTQAINIQGQPRKVTGASFFVLNEALKSSSGLSGKCSIVEDGLMVQIMPAKMEEVRQALRNQTDIDIVCGPIGATDEQSEIVSIKWVDNDREINVGVKSPIDEKPMDGVANMRVHASFNYSNTNYAIRLSDIFIIKCEDWYATNGGNYADITRIAEQLARSASMALLPFLDLLAAAGINKLALRATLDQENVCYEAGARGSKLPPLYMNALDNHLIATLHGESSGIQDPIILELVFYILNA
ncbi:PREDICTED: zinc finger FYVE domain-containing protein 9 isoform X5 [Drosophila arizonae]|uniref:Zinc finger FYVE domain-containing protein n=1 Tax=Drosophila arizonae TaxID=7263 RepID=A0ABM1PEB1_DROAR|nr:PREDICTED: zinc finger FYVE domain-containing protein 9 isoform X5 [Drosophila arizonae]